MGMNVLVNRHHADLYWSFYLLAQRLGWTLYIPYGMEWFDQGYFKMHDHPDKKEPARYMAKWFLEDDIWGGQAKHSRMGCVDYPPLRPLRLDDLVDLDVIICTNRENEEPFRKYRDEKQAGAKLVRQVGNRHDVVGYENGMFSDLESFNSNNTPHKILYHQEFDLNLFTYEPIQNFHNIYAFQHNLEKYEPAEELWKDHQRKFQQYNFKFFGKGNDGGYIYPKREYIKKMRQATFIWMVKDWDGYSHVVHNAFALGRPMIVRRKDIKGKIFEPLCDETTCIFTDQMDKLGKNVERMSKNCYKRFKEVVDFDEEEKQLRKFFEGIL